MGKLAWLVVSGALAFGLVGYAQARDDVPAALKPYMTEDEYRAAGLHKLNPAERAQFQAWFVRTMDGRRAAAPPAVQASPTAPEAPADPVVARAGKTDAERLFGNEQLENAREMTARIVGTFTGWDGKTRFELDNGQVWETVGSTTRFVPLQPIESAAVTIKRGAFNSYRMQVEGYNRWAQVTRIE